MQSSLLDRFLQIHYLDLSTLTIQLADTAPAPGATPVRHTGAVQGTRVVYQADTASQTDTASLTRGDLESKPVDVHARRERGLEIAMTRAIVGFGNTYLVQGSDPNNPYTVEVTPAGIAICTCPDYRYRCQKANTNCKHGHAVLAQIAAAGERREAA